MEAREYTDSTRASSRKTRVFVFREFLLQTYGKDYLTNGSTVIDAAGGKGDLSWLLCNIDDLKSVVIDPRITKKNHILRSVRYLRNNPEEAKIRSVRDLPTYQPLATLLPELEERQSDDDFSQPSHLRILLNDELVAMVSGVRKGTVDVAEWSSYWKDALDVGMQVQPLGYHEQEEKQPSVEFRNAQKQSCRNRVTERIHDADEALQMILSSKLIVGFHPDQATESAIDLAIELGIPFCVVPCCVFPSEFPHRTLMDSDDGYRRVRTYYDLIEYLKLKTPHIQTASLNFHFTETAKNIVLFTKPSATDYENGMKTR